MNLGGDGRNVAPVGKPWNMTTIHHLPCLVQDDSHFHPLLMVDLPSNVDSSRHWKYGPVEMSLVSTHPKNADVPVRLMFLRLPEATSHWIPLSYHGISHDIPHQKARDLPLKVTANPRGSSHWIRGSPRAYPTLKTSHWIIILPSFLKNGFWYLTSFSPLRLSFSHHPPISLPSVSTTRIYHGNQVWPVESSQHRGDGRGHASGHYRPGKIGESLLDGGLRENPMERNGSGPWQRPGAIFKDTGNS